MVRAAGIAPPVVAGVHVAAPSFGHAIVGVAVDLVVGDDGPREVVVFVSTRMPSVEL